MCIQCDDAEENGIILEDDNFPIMKLYSEK